MQHHASRTRQDQPSQRELFLASLVQPLIFPAAQKLLHVLCEHRGIQIELSNDQIRTSLTRALQEGFFRVIVNMPEEDSAEVLNSEGRFSSQAAFIARIDDMHSAERDTHA